MPPHNIHPLPLRKQNPPQQPCNPQRRNAIYLLPSSPIPNIFHAMPNSILIPTSPIRSQKGLPRDILINRIICNDIRPEKLFEVLRTQEVAVIELVLRDEAGGGEGLLCDEGLQGGEV